MKTVVTVGGTLAKSARLFAVVAMCLGATSVMAANYWIGADGADLADANNWAEGGSPTGAHVLPTVAAGYFANKSGLSQYSMSLSSDLSLYQLYWFLPNLKTVLDLGGHTLTLTYSGDKSHVIRFESDKTGAESIITNGTLTFSTSSQTIRILGSNQTQTFGEGLILNGNAELVSASAQSGSRIVVKDGAKVNGRLSIGNYFSNGEVLITGDGTEVNFGGANMVLSSDTATKVSDLTSYSNRYYVANGALITNIAEFAFGATKGTFGNVLVVSNAEMYANKVSVGNAAGHDCNRLEITGAGTLLRALANNNANSSGNGSSNVVRVTKGATCHATGTTYLGHGAGFGNQLIVDSYATNIYDGTSQYLYVGCSGATNGTSVFVGDGALLNPRCLGVLGYNNDFTISNGVLKISRLFYVNSSGVGADTCFRFKGAKPQLLIPSGASDPEFGSGVKPKFIFEIPAGGYTAVPIDCVQSWTFPEDAELEVDASAYSKAGGGKLVLARVTGGQKTLNISDTLLTRWNSELASKNCSVSYDSTERTLFLTVTKPGLAVFVR